MSRTIAMPLKFLGLVAVAGAVFVGAVTAYAHVQDRRMDSTRLVERLDDTPLPDVGLVLVDSWSRDGDWLFKPRPPEAVRIYIASLAPADACAEIEVFYRFFDRDVRPSTTSDDDITCIWNITGVRIWVEPTRPWTDIPPELARSPGVSVVRFSA